MTEKAKSWIRAHSVRSVVEQMPPNCAVSGRAVYDWLSGRMSPRPDRARALVAMAKADSRNGGRKARLTLADFVGGE